MPTATRTVSLRLIVVDLHRREIPVADICRAFDVPRSTAYRWINEAFAARLPHPSDFAIRLEHERCEHDPIRVGELTVCPTCCKSGYDHHPTIANARPLPKDPPTKHQPTPGLKGGV